MATANQALPTYIYKGKNKAGKPVTGEVKGNNPMLIKAHLRKQGIVPSSLKKKSKPLFGGGKAIKPADIAVFTRQIATMLKAGVPLVQSFEIIAEGAENPTLKALINSLYEDVSAGNSFGSALRKHPKYFDDLFCSLVEAGEQAGALDTLLARIATYKEKTERLKAKIRKALTYPAAVVVVAIIVTGILLIKVVPVFAQTYSSFGANLPAFTMLVMGFSEFAQKWWLPILAAMIGAGYAFKEALRRSPKFSDNVDKYLLKAPIIGQIINNAAIARFSSTLATTFAAGVPLMEALQSVAGAVGNAVFRDAVLQVRDDVTTGLSIHSSMKSTQVFPVMLLQLASIGEESGSLDEMMERAAEHYEEAVDNAVDNLTALLEPMIMAVLGVVVGGLLIAMYLPIFNLGQVI
ncbi:MAG: type II secretion system F family protein [Porticoccaceae bacterium]